MTVEANRLAAVVRHHAEASPDAVALIDGDTGATVTYGELLPPLVPSGRSLCFLLMRQTIAHVQTYVQLLGRSGAVALIDPATHAERFADMVDRYSPELILGTDADLATFGLKSDSVDGVGPLPCAQLSDRLAGELHPELELLLSTSGSTGSPKFVRLSSRNVLTNASGIAAALGIAPEDRAITCLPLHYTYGLSILHSHLAAGASVICLEPILLDQTFWNAFRIYGGTALAGVPFSYKIYDRLRLLDDPPSNLQVMTQAGGKLDAATVRRYATTLADQGRRFYVMYGQTEATARMSVLPHELACTHPDTVGFPLPDGRFEIEPPRSSTGEIIYRGPNVMLGYATTRADLAKGDDLSGVLRTGDVGHLTAEGLLRITGRLKRIAKVSGVRVSLDDVEAAAARFVRAVAVAGADRIRLVVEGTVDDERALRRDVAQAAGLIARDLEVVVVEELPRTSNGKVDYVRLGPTL